MIVKKSDRPFLIAAIAPATAFLMLFAFYATAYLIYSSLHNWNISNPSPVFAGLRNFAFLLSDANFWESLWRTFVYLVFALVLQMILGLIIAVLMDSIVVGTNVMRAIIILPMAITPVVSGLIWRILYDPTLGLLNYLLSLVGIKGAAWVANSSTALAAIVLVDIWQWTPFSVLLVAAGLKALPTEPYESARMDGASAIQLFFYVTLPLLKNTLYVLILFRSIDIIKVFDIIYVITGGGPGVWTQTATYYTFLQGFGWFNLGYASTIALTILIFVIVLTEIFIRRTGVLREN